MYDEILIFSNLPAGEQARRGRKKAFGEDGKKRSASAKQKNSESEAIAGACLRATNLLAKENENWFEKSGCSRIGGKITVFDKGRGN